MSEKTLLSYWMVLYKRKKSIFLVTAVSVVTAVIISKLVTPVYEAKAVFYVPKSSVAISYMSKDVSDGLSRDMAIPAAKEDDAGPYIGMLKSMKIAEMTNKEFPGKSIRKLLLTDMDFSLSNEFMLRIYSRDNDPALAADVANAYMKNLNIMLQEASLENPAEDSRLMNAKLKESEERLRAAEDELKNYEEKSNIVSVDEEGKQITAQRTAFQTQYENTRVLANETDEKIRSFTEQLKKESGLVSANDFVLTNPRIQFLQNKLSDLSAQIAGSSIELREDHPDLKILRNQYAEVSASLKKEVQGLVSSQVKPGVDFYEQLRQNLVSLIIERSRLQASMKGQAEAIERITLALKKLPSIKSQLNILSSEVERARKISEQLKADIQENEMQKARSIQYVTVVDYAKPPSNPSFPILWLNVLIAIIFGVMAGIVYAFLLDYIEETRDVRTLKIIKTILSAKN